MPTRWARILSAQGSPWLTNAALLLFGLIYLDLTRTGVHEWTHYVHGFSETIFGQLMLYLGGIALVERSPRNRWTLPIILVVAFGARLIAALAPPFLSTDIYRYVWDGIVQLHGINPYRYIPADPHLSFLRDGSIYPHINRREYAHTIYPPAAEFLYLLVARIHASVVAMKLAMVALEGVTCWALFRCLRLLGQPGERVLLYAWHPVCIWEIASSGHVDGASLTFIALAILLCLQRKPRGASAWLAVAALIKMFPLALLPAFTRRRVWGPLLVFVGVVAAAYLPYLSVGRGVLGFLPEYAKEEGLESGVRYFPLDWLDRTFHATIAPQWYEAGCAAALAGLAWWAFRRGATEGNCVSSGLVLATAVNLCFSPHYPWYFLWLLPFLALWPWRPAFFLVLGATYMLATKLGAPGQLYRMNERLYGVFLLLLVTDLLFRASYRRKQFPRAGQRLQPERETVLAR